MGGIQSKILTVCLHQLVLSYNQVCILDCRRFFGRQRLLYVLDSITHRLADLLGNLIMQLLLDRRAGVRSNTLRIDSLGGVNARIDELFNGRLQIGRQVLNKPRVQTESLRWWLDGRG